MPCSCSIKPLHRALFLRPRKSPAHSRSTTSVHIFATYRQLTHHTHHTVHCTGHFCSSIDFEATSCEAAASFNDILSYEECRTGGGIFITLQNVSAAACLFPICRIAYTSRALFSVMVPDFFEVWNFCSKPQAVHATANAQGASRSRRSSSFRDVVRHSGQAMDENTDDKIPTSMILLPCGDKVDFPTVLALGGLAYERYPSMLGGASLCVSCSRITSGRRPA